MSAPPPLLQVERASVRYTLRGAGLFAPARTLDALTDVSIAIPEGGRLGVVAAGVVLSALTTSSPQTSGHALRAR